MSPRRSVKAVTAFDDRPPPAPRKWGLAAAMAASVALIVSAITVSALLLITHEKLRRAEVKEAAALSYVESFMADYTSLDPFHANDYADRVLAQATGQLAQDYKARLNEIVVQVARAEPSRGSVVDAGVQRWNDDGSADVVVATKMTTTMPDGKKVESASRWLATTIREGDQWKISNLLEVI
jgi:Mce-associated membrane protein